MMGFLFSGDSFIMAESSALSEPWALRPLMENSGPYHSRRRRFFCSGVATAR
jgi:hypothetical protein